MNCKACWLNFCFNWVIEPSLSSAFFVEQNQCHRLYNDCKARLNSPSVVSLLDKVHCSCNSIAPARPTGQHLLFNKRLLAVSIMKIFLHEFPILPHTQNTSIYSCAHNFSEINIVQMWSNGNIAAWFIDENTLRDNSLSIGRPWWLNSFVTSCCCGCPPL